MPRASRGLCTGQGGPWPCSGNMGPHPTMGSEHLPCPNSLAVGWGQDTDHTAHQNQGQHHDEKKTFNTCGRTVPGECGQGRTLRRPGGHCRSPQKLNRQKGSAGHGLSAGSTRAHSSAELQTGEACVGHSCP